MSQHSVQHEPANGHGRYVIHLDGGKEAELTYQQTDPKIMVIDHTFVPPSHRGRGIAERLVERAIDDARSNDVRISPVCPYVAVLFRRHPEWSDLRAG